jgi:hypothetical protein
MAVGQACLEAWPMAALHLFERKFTDASIIQTAILPANRQKVPYGMPP